MRPARLAGASLTCSGRGERDEAAVAVLGDVGVARHERKLRGERAGLVIAERNARTPGGLREGRQDVVLVVPSLEGAADDHDTRARGDGREDARDVPMEVAPL